LPWSRNFFLLVPPFFLRPPPWPGKVPYVVALYFFPPPRIPDPFSHRNNFPPLFSRGGVPPPLDRMNSYIVVMRDSFYETDGFFQSHGGALFPTPLFLRGSDRLPGHPSCASAQNRHGIVSYVGIRSTALSLGLSISFLGPPHVGSARPLSSLPIYAAR